MYGKVERFGAVLCLWGCCLEHTCHCLSVVMIVVSVEEVFLVCKCLEQGFLFYLQVTDHSVCSGRLAWLHIDIQTFGFFCEETVQNAVKSVWLIGFEAIDATLSLWLTLGGLFFNGEPVVSFCSTMQAPRHPFQQLNLCVSVDISAHRSA